VTTTTNHKAAHPQRRCGSSAGSSHSWRHGGPDHGGSEKRFAWPQAYKTGQRNHGQTVSRRMYAHPDTGQGGATSKPNPRPEPVGKPGGGSGPKVA
jgi:hypothetical protein